MEQVREMYTGDPVAALIERFALTCKPYRTVGTWILESVQRYVVECPTFIYRWLIRIDQATVAEIVRRAVPVASCDEKVWRLIARTYKRKNPHAGCDPKYL